MSTKELGKTYIMFPEDGHQPTTEEAGEYSGARITDENESKKVTSWYMYVFGGKEVEEYMGDDLPKISQKNAVYPSFGINGRNIITVGDSETPDKKKLKNVFWSRFKKIASDPVGRVLLYRLLIEIRRSCKNGGVPEFYKSEAGKRDPFRSIFIEDSSQREHHGGYFARDLSKPSIGIVPDEYESCPTVVAICNDKVPTYKAASVRRKDGTLRRCDWTVITGKISTVPAEGTEVDYPKDISLFHEMLHWFHYLRDYKRYLGEDTKRTQPYAYGFECYYGKKDNTAQQRKALKMWEGYSESKSQFYYEGEEIRTILGIPFAGNKGIRGLMPNKPVADRRFLNGDDISENTYRLSRSDSNITYKMRFGHTYDTFEEATITMGGGMPNESNGLHQNAFKLAHKVAMSCYKDITGTEKKGWNLVPGEAAENLTE